MTSPDASSESRKPVNWRSVLIGLLGVFFINALTPFNNFVLNNTSLVSNSMPLGLLLFFLVIVILINAPLWKYAPRHAIQRAELAVALSMVLVSCTIPAVGLMRYLPGNLSMLYFWSAENPNYAQVMDQAKPADWAFPDFDNTSASLRGGEKVVQEFYTRSPAEADTFIARMKAVPWGKWVRPFFTWGLFVTFLYGAVICLNTIMRKQWVENERLPFPIAGIYMSIIESPPKGRGLNTLFSNPTFWVAACMVFFIHSLSGLNAYNPLWPVVPMTYNLVTVLADSPLQFTEEYYLQQSQIFFTVIGITYFIQSRVSFSLFSFFLVMQVVRVIYGTMNDTYTEPMSDDMMLGAIIPFAFLMLYTARAHLAMVVRQMFFRKHAGDQPAKYLPYSVSGWGLVLCAAGLTGWLICAGMSPIAAVLLVFMLLVYYLALARIIAETGLLYVLIPIPLSQPWMILANTFPGVTGVRTTVTSYFWARFFSGVLVHDTREALPSYAAHSLRLADQAAYDEQPTRQKPIWFIGSLVMALVVAWCVASISTMYIHYSYTSTLDKTPITPLSDWATLTMPRNIALDGTVKYAGNADLNPGHSHWLHIGTGFGVMTVLGSLTLMSASWPLHPLGFLLCNTWGLKVTWFSIMLGWIAKQLIVRLGGSTLYVKLRPVFIGLILGEVAAVAFWLIVALILNALGMEYHTVQLLPI